MRRRALIIICILVGIAIAVIFAGLNPYPTIAVWLAPDKMPTPSASMSEQAKAANTKFWDAFHGGRYEQLPEVLEALTAAYIEDPRDATTAAHIGFAHVWRLNEQGRIETPSATITDHIVLSRKYFAEAVRLGRMIGGSRGFSPAWSLPRGPCMATRSSRAGDISI